MLAPVRKGEVRSVGTVMKGEGRVLAPLWRERQKVLAMSWNGRGRVLAPLWRGRFTVFWHCPEGEGKSAGTRYGHLFWSEREDREGASLAVGYSIYSSCYSMTEGKMFVPTIVLQAKGWRRRRVERTGWIWGIKLPTRWDAVLRKECLYTFVE